MKKHLTLILLTVVISGCATTQQTSPQASQDITEPVQGTAVELVKQHLVDTKRVKTDRYTSVDLKPLPEQLDLLSVVISTKIPNGIDTVKQAVEFLLMRSGYSLLDISQQSEETRIMMSNTLPEAHRNIQSMPLRSALSMLAGPAFDLKENDVYRSIIYKKK